ncbi:MAG: hypothetical protein V4675_23670 [Verrucomicrobiota bacterium]
MKLDKIFGFTMVLYLAAVASAQEDLPLATATAETGPAISSAEIAIVGRVVYPGWLTLAGGGSYYDDLTFEILTTIKGSAPLWTPPKPVSPGPDGVADWNLYKLPPALHEKSVALTKWRLNGPAKYSKSKQREAPPLLGKDYIVAGSMKNGTLLVGKLLPATSEHLENVRTILGLTSIDSSRLQLPSNGSLPFSAESVIAQIKPRNQFLWVMVAVAFILGAALWRALGRRG